MSSENFEEVKKKVEAILFSYGDWLLPHEIMNALSLDSELLINNSLKELEEKYRDNYSFNIEKSENSKWRMALKPEYEDIVSDLITNIEIPKNVLKVLSIIAYEQPVTKTRLLEILGRSVKKEVNYLYRNKFLSYEKKGIGKYYRVTKKFYDYFKIESNEDFRDIADNNITQYIQDFSDDENSADNQQDSIAKNNKNDVYESKLPNNQINNKK